jgi:hypothetical protein
LLNVVLYCRGSSMKCDVCVYKLSPLSYSMSVSTFSKFPWTSGNPTCSCHIFYTNRRFPVCGYRHLAEKIWGCRRKRRNCQSHVTVDRTNTRYIYIERFYNINRKSSVCVENMTTAGRIAASSGELGKCTYRHTIW